MAVSLDERIFCWGKKSKTPKVVKDFLQFNKIFTSSLSDVVFAINYRSELFGVSRDARETKYIYTLPSNCDIRISVGGRHAMVMMSPKQAPWLKNTRNFNDVQIILL